MYRSIPHNGDEGPKNIHLRTVTQELVGTKQVTSSKIYRNCCQNDSSSVLNEDSTKCR